MWFTRKCSCGNSPAVHTQIIPTMAGNAKLHRCVECHFEKMKYDTEAQERSRIAFAKEREEREKQRRLEYLQREIALREAEAAAKALGIE